MIAKDSGNGKSFAGIAKYLETGRKGENQERVAWFDGHNLDSGSIQQSAQLMKSVANENTRVEKPVYHFSINWHPDESELVDRALGLEIAREAIKDLGLEEHQALIVAHKDTDHFHIHIVANRIHPETEKAWVGSYSKIKLENSMARLSLEHGFEIVPGRHNSKELGIEPPHADLSQPSQALRFEQRTDSPSFDTKAKLEVPLIVERSDSWGELHANLQENGYQLQQRKNGLVFVDEDGHFTKASSISRNYSKSKLEQHFEKAFVEPERTEKHENRDKAINQTNEYVPLAEKLALEAAKPSGRDQGRERVLEPQTTPEGKLAAKIDSAMSKLEEHDALTKKTNDLFIARQEVLQRTQNSFDQFQKLSSIKADVRTAFEAVYADPETAMKKFVKQFDKLGADFAINDLGLKPETYGKLQHGRASRFAGVFVENDSVKSQIKLANAIKPYKEIVGQIEIDLDRYKKDLDERFSKGQKAELQKSQKRLKSMNRIDLEQNLIKAAEKVKIADVSKLPFSSDLRATAAQNRLTELYGQKQDRRLAREQGFKAGADYKRFPSMPTMAAPEDKAAFMAVDKYAREKHSFDGISRWMNEGSAEGRAQLVKLQEAAENVVKAGPLAEKHFHRFKVDQRVLYETHLKPAEIKTDSATLQKQQEKLQKGREKSVKSEMRRRQGAFAKTKSPNIQRDLGTILRVLGIPVPRIPMPRAPQAVKVPKELTGARTLGRELKRD